MGSAFNFNRDGDSYGDESRIWDRESVMLGSLVDRLKYCYEDREVGVLLMGTLLFDS